MSGAPDLWLVVAGHRIRGEHRIGEPLPYQQARWLQERLDAYPEPAAGHARRGQPPIARTREEKDEE